MGPSFEGSCCVFSPVGTTKTSWCRPNHLLVGFKEPANVGMVQALHNNHLDQKGSRKASKKGFQLLLPNEL